MANFTVWCLVINGINYKWLHQVTNITPLWSLTQPGVWPTCMVDLLVFLFGRRVSSSACRVVSSSLGGSFFCKFEHLWIDVCRYWVSIKGGQCQLLSHCLSIPKSAFCTLFCDPELGLWTRFLLASSHALRTAWWSQYPGSGTLWYFVEPPNRRSLNQSDVYHLQINPIGCPNLSLKSLNCFLQSFFSRLWSVCSFFCLFVSLSFSLLN